MDRRDFLTTVASLPLIRLEPLLSVDGPQEFAIPTRCRVPQFRSCDRRLIVDYDEMCWPVLGGGWPACIYNDELRIHRQDWFILVDHALGWSSHFDSFDGDILLGEITTKLAKWLDAADIDPDPWPGMGFGWREVADWLRQGECLLLKEFA